MTFGVPIALVSLIDETPQFKSRCGLDASETPRSIAFCSHAVALGNTLVSEDATQDPRFTDNPDAEYTLIRKNEGRLLR